MAIATATITFDLSAHLSISANLRYVRVWATTNIDGQTIFDDLGDDIQAGSYQGTVNLITGLASIVVPVPGGTNPETWQTYVHMIYPDNAAKGGMGSVTYGPFTVTVSAALSALVEEQTIPPVTISKATADLDRKVEQAALLAAQVGGFVKLRNGGALAPFWDTDVTTKRADVLMIGDSITEGVGAPTWAQRLPVALQSSLRTMRPIAGTQGAGYIPAVNYSGNTIPGLTLAGGPVADMGDGIGGKSLGITTGKSVTLTFTGTRVGVRYAWLDWLSAVCDIKIDGGAAVELSGTTTRGGNLWLSPVLSAGSHTIQIIGKNASPFRLEGFEVFGSAQDVTAGVHVYDAAHGGWASNNFTTAALPAMWDAVDKIKPVLTVINLGTNDVSFGTSVATVASNISAIAARAAAAAAGPAAVLVVIPYKSVKDALAGYDAWWNDYRTALLGLAGGNIAVLDMQASWPTLGTNDGKGVMYETTGIIAHPNAAGHALQAGVIAGALVQPPLAPADDAGVKALVETPGSQTAVALAAAIATEVGSDVASPTGVIPQTIAAKLATRDAARRLGELYRPPSPTVYPPTLLGTISVSATAPTGRTLDAWNAAGKFRYSAAPILSDGGGTMRTSPYASVPTYSIEFDYSGDGLVLGFKMLTGPESYRLFIDDQPVSLTLTALATGNQYITVPFAALGTYRVRVVMSGMGVFYGVYRDAVDTIAIAPERTRLAIIGDSYVGRQNDVKIQTIGYYIGLRTGWDVFEASQGSTGYVADSSAPRKRFGDATRMPYITAWNPDVIMVVGSVNDPWQSIPAATTGAAATTLYAQLDTLYPGVPVVVVGVEPVKGVNATDCAPTNAAIKAAAEAAPNVVGFIDWYAESWLTGTGKTTATTGTGNQDMFIGADGVHTSVAGNEFLGKRLASVMADMALAKAP